MRLIISSENGRRREFLSPDLALIENEGYSLLYDRLRGGGTVFGPPATSLISDLLAQQYHETECSLNGQVWGPILESLRTGGFLWSHQESPPDLRLDSVKISEGSYVRQLSLMVALECNYTCKDCFVFNEATNIVPKSIAFMNWETAQEALSRFFTFRSQLSPGGVSVVRIFGGEPLLNWALIEQIVTWVRSHEMEDPVYVTTNGSMLNQQRAAFLAKNDVTLFISLNGIEAVNDRIRLDNHGRGTFRQTVRGLVALMHEVKEVHVSFTISDDEEILRLPEFIDYLDNVREDPTLPITIYLSLMKGQVNETRFRRPEAELVKLIADEWVAGVRRNIYLAGRLFHCFHNVFLTPEKFDRWCERGSGIVVYPDGNVRPCSGSGHLLGRLSDFPKVLSSEAFYLVSRRIGGQIPRCAGCAVEGLCGGSCACSSRAGLHEYLPGINCDFERAIFRKAVKAFLTLYSKDPAGMRSIVKND